uniref:Battenin n=1 Tax=Meloidogyne floridensis TaxID=298350 RepID=A0A915PEK6_9BILA
MFLFNSGTFYSDLILFYSYLNGQHSSRIASLLLLTQFAAGYFSYFVSKTFYSFGLHFKHLEALEGNCSSDLTVAIIYGSVVEAIGLLSCKIAEHFIDETLIDEKYVTIVLSAISGLITILGNTLCPFYRLLACPVVCLFPIQMAFVDEQLGNCSYL